jgi:polyisoprenoid-binding protein YceI
MRAVLVAIAIGSLTVLAGCPRPQMVEAPPAKAPEVPASELAGANIYRIDPAQSHVHVLVYRGGPMARFGHNHVMTVRGLSGRVWFHPQAVARSGFEMRFPVAQMIVDDRDARLVAGPEFPPDVPEKDKVGTRMNMLREAVLNGAAHPHIELRSIAVNGVLPVVQIAAAITLKGVTREVQVPAVVSIDEQRLQVQGEFTIRQTDFGITPFSVAMGAVQVADELRIRFDVNAVRWTGPATNSGRTELGIRSG